MKARYSSGAFMLVEVQSGFELSADTEHGGARFRMVAHSGGVVGNHPLWGNLAIDFDGLRIGRQRVAVLESHDVGRIIGWTEKIDKTSRGLIVDGVFAQSTEAGRNALKLAREGFPWQASVKVPASVIERVQVGVSLTVNGHTMTGPGHVFRKAALREVSFCPVGADENTSAVALADQGGEYEADVLTVPGAGPLIVEPDKGASLEARVCAADTLAQAVQVLTAGNSRMGYREALLMASQMRGQSGPGVTGAKLSRDAEALARRKGCSFKDALCELQRLTPLEQAVANEMHKRYGVPYNRAVQLQYEAR